MGKLGPKGMKLLRLIHVMFAIMWFGGALSMILLYLLVTPQSAEQIYIHSLDLKTIDDWIVIVGANGCLLTGLIYGIFTKWGFFRHGWLAAKWVLTIFMISSGTFAMGPVVNGNVELGEQLVKGVADSAWLVSAYWENVKSVMPWTYLQNALLLITIILSVYKPWKAKNK